jgi:hypothetical protein
MLTGCAKLSPTRRSNAKILIVNSRIFSRVDEFPRTAPNPRQIALPQQSATNIEPRLTDSLRQKLANSPGVGTEFTPSLVAYAGINRLLTH